jgi:DNA-nicking Smr family endonuclease
MRKQLNDDDSAEWELFRRTMHDMIPFASDKIEPLPPQLKPVPRQRQLDEQQVLNDMLSEWYDPAELETGEELLFMRPGIQHAMLRKLRRGHYSVRAELDLHGLLVPEARQTVSAFLHECRLQRWGCVRIIHGKGNGSRHKQPVLKIKLNHWLRQYDSVLAFCSARSMDGGTGAVYVLLRHGA